ncbi:hydroxyisourate hydrolase [Caulobacter hibisci]|uniref:5-hydroxyisourate hydrolase n=1 Tax=Caulobacter hibisci TaxID=2035993 RepID=A0ABS0T4U7_9CAUL|nr:hydroxyisourate hydrolase [Caulobacter hibisci]MBI1686912.1 hydroxyisourate hydrolase [Caulobacter hibisci]
MSGLTTHILDTAAGQPAARVALRVYRRGEGAPVLLKTVETDADGRARLVEGEALAVGGYRIEFDVAAYFAASGAKVSDPPFLDVVTIDFSVADPTQHHHVPLLVSPFGYSTYRGS